MATSLYKLYQEFSRMDIPKGYKVVFEFDEFERIVLKVFHTESGMSYSWSIAPIELEKYKLDFVKEHIHALIDGIEEKLKDVGE